MSRIGKLPLMLPDNVIYTETDGKIIIKGPKGQLERSFSPKIKISKSDDKIIVERISDDKIARGQHGLTRTLLNNMITGVVDGFTKKLEIVGVGYKVAKTGKNLQLNIGLSHPVIVEPPSGIDLQVEGVTKIAVSGIDKEVVGQVAANIRKIRPPEPYKGKGIRYEGEYIAKKMGKAGKVGSK